MKILIFQYMAKNVFLYFSDEATGEKLISVAIKVLLCVCFVFTGISSA